MAELDPYAPNEGQGNYLGYSKGTVPDTSIGGLFTDAASLVQNTATNLSQYFQQSAREQFTAAADELRNVFTGRSDTDATANARRVGGGNAVPSEVTAHAERLQALTDMYKAGRLQESHYWTLLDVEARKVRQRYPGFRAEIDQMVSSVVGTNPANRLVQQLHAEATANATSGARRQERLYDEAFQQARDLGLIGDASQRNQQGRPLTIEELTSRINNYQSNDRKTKGTLQELSLASAQGQNVRESAIRNATSDLFSNYANTLRVGTSAIATSRQEFNRRMNTLLSNPQAAADPKALTELRQYFISQVYQPTMAWANARLYEPQTVDSNGRRVSHSELITANGGKLDTVIAEFQRNLDLMAGALGDGGATPNWSLVQALATNAAAFEKGDLANGFRASPTLRRMNVIRHGAGNTFSNLTAFRNVDTLDDILNADIFNGTTAVISGENSPQEIIQQGRGNPARSAGDQGVVGREVITRATEVLTDPNTPDALLATTATSMFGPNNRQLLDQISNKSDIYSIMVGDPRVATNMQRVRNSPGGQQIYENYRSWVVTGFSTAMTEAARTAQNVVLQGGPTDRTNLTYNPDTNVFLLTEGTAGQTQAVNTINRNIQGFSAMLKAEGRSPEEINALVGRQVQGLDIDLNRSRTTTTGQSLWDRMRMVGWRLTGNTTGTPEAPPVGPNSPEGTRRDTAAPLLDEIGRGEAGQFGYNQVFDRNRMGARNADLTGMTLSGVMDLQREIIGSQRDNEVPQSMRSSAVGKYQFIQQALKDTIKEMNLDPNTTVFTPQVQDQMAMHQLRKAGLDTFLANPTPANRETLINKMSRFWAALPNTSGRGSYDGIAGNRANRSLVQINRILDQLVEQERGR